MRSRDKRFLPNRKEVLLLIEEGLKLVALSPRLMEGLKSLSLDDLIIINNKLKAIANFDRNHRFKVIDTPKDEIDYLAKMQRRKEKCDEISTLIERCKNIKKSSSFD